MLVSRHVARNEVRIGKGGVKALEKRTPRQSGTSAGELEVSKGKQILRWASSSNARSEYET